MKLLELADPLKLRREFGFFDDFEWLITLHRWTTLVADSGTSVAVADAAGGVVQLTTGATDNNEALIKTASEIFLFAADKPAVYEARAKWTEANTDDANVALGWADAVGANTMVDDGAGMKASYSGAVFYKVDGGTTWNFQTSLGATRTTTALVDASNSGAYQTLRIEAREQGNVIELVPWIDGRQCVDATYGRPVKHYITLGSPTEMQAFAYVKAGGANSEVLNVDYVAAFQLR